MSLDTADDSGAPRVLDKYEVLRRLGRGGMADVFLARTSGLGGFEKLCVVKRVRSRFEDDPTMAKMLLDEARIAATLSHSNIVQVFEVGIADGAPFVAMEFLHGRDLSAIMRALRKSRKQLPLGAALAIVQGICAGLHYAHDKKSDTGAPLGIVHRDVSPHNVIVTYDGAVRVIDFGIAKVGTSQAHTREGVVKGKLGYMSPEQCRCERLDRRSDVFCIGIVLYELTTLRRAFSGDNEYALLKAAVEGPTPQPTAVDPGYPRDLERIVTKALARDRADRYTTALELQRELDGFARDRGLAATQLAIADCMQDLFSAEIEEWQTAKSSGVSLARHMTASWKPAEDDAEDAASPRSPGGDSPTGGVRGTSSPENTARGRPLSRLALLLLALAVVGGAAFLTRSSWQRGGTVTEPDRGKTETNDPVVSPAALAPQASQAPPLEAPAPPSAEPTRAAPVVTTARAKPRPAPRPRVSPDDLLKHSD